MTAAAKTYATTLWGGAWLRRQAPSLVQRRRTPLGHDQSSLGLSFLLPLSPPPPLLLLVEPSAGLGLTVEDTPRSPNRALRVRQMGSWC